MGPLSLVVWSTCLLGIASTDEINGSYLHAMLPCADARAGTQVEPYTPHEGDIVLYDDHSRLWKFLYRVFGSDLPDHAGIVVSLPNGEPVLLESGPDDGKLAGPYVCLLEVNSRLHQFRGTAYVRRLRCPLSHEQSQRLTSFALEQEGKVYAVGRLLLQGTPFRCRGPLRSHLFGKTYSNRRHWLCAELVVAAGTAAGLFDPRVDRANTMYPKDLFDDSTHDLSRTWMEPAIWSAVSTPIQ
jgi:hypothetical protein